MTHYNEDRPHTRTSAKAFPTRCSTRSHGKAGIDFLMASSHRRPELAGLHHEHRWNVWRRDHGQRCRCRAIIADHSR
jgi:hypothetical protein